MRFKKLRVAAAITAAAAVIPVVGPAQARVLMERCEREAWDSCEAQGNSPNTVEFAVCYEAMKAEYCPPPQIPYPITW